MPFDLDFSDWTLWNNSIERWLIALLVFLIALMVLRTVRNQLVKRVTALAERTKTTLDDVALELLNKTRFFFLFAVALYIASTVLTLPQSADDFMVKATFVLVMLQVVVWGNHLVTYLVAHYVRLEAQEGEELKTSTSALVFMGKLLLVSLAVVLTLGQLGFEISPLITSLGIGGIAVALAIQNILGDLFASLSILLDKPFRVGDFIVVDSYLCTVEHIGLKTTRARSNTGEQVIFANSDLLKSRLRNFKRMQERRAIINIGVIYQTPHQKLEKIPSIVQEVVEATPETRFDRVHFKAFGDFSLNFEAVFWVTKPDYLTFMNTIQAVNLAIFKRFEEEEIEFAYPTQTVFVDRSAPARLGLETPKPRA